MAAADIKITEILYDPLQTSSQDKLYEWVEIQNTGPDPVVLDGWTLDDERTTNTQIGYLPNITLQAGEIAILYNGSITEVEFLTANPSIPAGTVLIPITNWQQLNNSDAAGGLPADAVNLMDPAGTVIASTSYYDTAAPGQSLGYSATGVAQGAGVPDPGVVTCFTAGSMIDTAHGPQRIETLQVGDRVRTLDHGLQTVRWIGRRLVSAAEQARSPALCPVRIEQGALGPCSPARTTRVSPQHRILVSNPATEALFAAPRMLCAAISLIGQPGIRQLPPAEAVEYIHILFDQHEVVFVDGQPSESFFPSQDGLEALSPLARAELFALFPELESAAFPVAYPVMTKTEAALLTR